MATDLKTDKGLTTERTQEVLQAFRSRPIDSSYPKSSRLLAVRLLEYCIQHEISRSTLAVLMSETGLCKQSAVESFLRLKEGNYYPYNPSTQVLAKFVRAFALVSGDDRILADYRTALLKDLGLTRAIDIDEGILRD